jgi:restriction system protein
MAVWLIRAGSHGEYEQKFIQENRVYVTWADLDLNLAELRQKSELTEAMTQRYPDAKPRAIANWVNQIWGFAHEIKTSDLVVLPLKTQRAIQVGEVTGDYHFEPGGPSPFFHWRPVKWIAEAVPRSHFGTDLLHSFGAYLTICRVERNNAEARLAQLTRAGLPEAERREPTSKAKWRRRVVVC